MSPDKRAKFQQIRHLLLTKQGSMTEGEQLWLVHVEKELSYEEV